MISFLSSYDTPSSYFIFTAKMKAIGSNHCWRRSFIRVTGKALVKFLHMFPLYRVVFVSILLLCFVCFIDPLSESSHIAMSLSFLRRGFRRFFYIGSRSMAPSLSFLCIHHNLEDDIQGLHQTITEVWEMSQTLATGEA